MKEDMDIRPVKSSRHCADKRQMFGRFLTATLAVVLVVFAALVPATAHAVNFNCANAYAKLKERISLALFGEPTEGSEYEIAMANYLAKNAPMLRDSIQREFLPPQRVEILESLGWKFQTADGNPISSPSLTELDDGYKSTVARLGIPVHRQLRPVRVAKTKDGNYIDVELKDELPEGARTVVAELPTEEVVKLLAAGKFPMGEFTEVTLGNTFLGAHDQIGHISTYIAHPDLAEALIDSAKVILRDTKGWPKEYGSTNAYNNKVRLALEYLTRSRVSAEEMAKELQIPKSLQTERTLTVSKIIQEDLSKKSLAELKSEAERIFNKFPKLVETLGGANTDASVFNRTPFARDVAQISRSGIEDYGYSYDDVSDLLVSARSRAELESSIAKAKAYLYGLSRTTPAQLVRDILRPELKRDSDLFRLNCLSQVFTRVVPWFNCSAVTQ
jgi:hypothetical protein